MRRPEPDPDRPLVVHDLGAGDQDGDGDVLAHGDGRRPRRGLAIVAAALAAIAVLVGYLHGRGQQHRADPAVTGAPHPPPQVVGAGDTCFAQLGNRLVLGVRVANQSGEPIELQDAQAMLPLGGLRFSRPWWTDCDHVAAQASQLPYHDASSATVPAGRTGWVTMVFDVLVDCPAPLPVQFVITYSQAGRTSQTTVHNFADLGDLPFAAPLCTGS
jgi:hypothetical protein